MQPETFESHRDPIRKPRPIPVNPASAGVGLVVAVQGPALGSRSPPALIPATGRHRLPPGDDPHALAGLGGVADQREVAAELDDTGQFATVLIGAADGLGGG